MSLAAEKGNAVASFSRAPPTRQRCVAPPEVAQAAGGVAVAAAALRPAPHRPRALSKLAGVAAAAAAAAAAVDPAELAAVSAAAAIEAGGRHVMPREGTAAPAAAVGLSVAAGGGDAA